MDVIGVQLDIAWEDKAANCVAVRRRLHDADVREGTFVILPEMFATGFSMDVAAIVEDVGGATEQFLAEGARQFGATVLGGVVTRSEAHRGRNEAVAFDPEGREIGRYAKIHPFSFAGEGDHYESGEGIVTFDVDGVTVAPFVCYDLRFPEVFRTAVRRGAELFAVIANWPQVREEHWVTLLRARAIENQACVVGVNRCGADPNHDYSGRSLIVDPRGEIIADAGSGAGLIRAELDLPALRDYRKQFPALQDMRDRPAR